MADDRAELEAKVKSLLEAGQATEAAGLAISGYGPDLFRFIAAMLRDEQAAADVFSQASEDILRGLPNMRWQSTLRTWAYSVARHACYRHLRSPERRRATPLSSMGEIAELTERVRHETLKCMRTDMKSRVSALRMQLKPEEQELLTLRIDRGLEWREIAEITAPDELSEAELKRNSAALRKRFGRVTDKLRKLAQEEGLIEEEEP